MLNYRPSHIDVKDAIAWAAMQFKYYYDINHQSQFFIIEDKVLLCLHCGYKLLSVINKKLEWQFVRLFKVTEWVEHLIYCLNLPSAWKIYDVISIAHLELASSNDSYTWA